MSKAYPPHYDEIHELVTAQLEEPDGSSSSQALQNLVSESNDARVTYVQYMQELYHIISRLAIPAPEEETSAVELRPTTQERSKTSRAKLSAIATISALILVGAFLWRSARVVRVEPSMASTNEVVQEKLRGQEVATLTKSNSVVWDGPGPPINELSRLKVGQELRLSEGTIEVGYDDSDWWITSAIRERQTLTKNHEGDIPAPEWIAFGDPRQHRSLVLLHHEDDAHPDRFYQMENEMTVFGFGRKGIDKFLDSVPQSVSICLLETDEPAAIAAALERISTSVAISLKLAPDP